jgi:uncharacterized protein YndB with AHSA1/START domain
MSDTTRRVTVSRRIEAPLDVVFGIISDPRQHANFDGSGMVIEADASASSPIGSVGCVFRMNMHNDEMGNYGMDNTVVEFEPGRRIIWQPKLAWATREEDIAEVGDSAMQLWGYEVEADGAAATVVTEIFDCQESPDWLGTAVRQVERWLDGMTESPAWSAAPAYVAALTGTGP